MIEREQVKDDNNQQSLLQEEYLKSLEDLEEGQLVDGYVIEMTPEHVFVDVGYKSEGKIPIEEFDNTPEIGENVSVVLVKKESRSGEVIVSKKKADMKVFWKNLRNSFNENEAVSGKVVKSIKGGFEVDLGYGVIAFNPISKIDVIRVENPEEYVGMESKFYIDRLYTENKVRIVVSRRNWLVEEIDKKREAFFESTQVGDEVEGTVKSFTSFGAFIDLGGFDGLLHLNDMSWGHATRPKDYVKKGDVIKLKVIKIDSEERKINLSLKHFSPDPWSVFETKYQVDDVVTGHVTKLADFGAFIEIEEGIEGLAHISELSWVKRIKHPKEILSIGDEVEVKILAYDLEQGRVSLGLKQVTQNPWDSIEERYPEGTHLKRKVAKITNAGAFIELEEGIDGFLHVDDISWTKKIKHASSILKEGEEAEIKVIGIDKNNHRIKLGMKQLTNNPWQDLQSEYKKGSIIEGEITNVTDFGVFVRVFADIEGLIPKNQLLAPGSDGDVDEEIKKLNVGDKIKTAVTEINTKAGRLSLSVREFQRSLQEKELSKYIHNEENESTFTLGDALKDQK